MSTSVNKGLQDLSFQYREKARSRYFNKILDKLVPVGIYEGGLLTRDGNTQVILKPLVCLIKTGNADVDAEYDVSVRVQTTANQSIDIEDGGNPGQPDMTKPYIVLRLDWAEEESNYMDMLAVSYSDDIAEVRDDYIQPEDIIVGKILFESDGGSGNQIKLTNSFDYTRRGDAFIPDSVDAFVELKVQSSENDPSNKVYVTQGILNTSSGRQSIVGGDYPTATDISPTTTFGRIDIVYVSESGDVLVEEGVPSASPVAPDYLNKKVIGEISRGPNRTDILGTDIYAVNVSRQGMVTAERFPIEDSGNYYTSDFVESALQQIGEQVYDNMIGSSNPDWIKDFHIDWGIGTNQVSAVDVPIEDALSLYVATEIETALEEVMQYANVINLALTEHAGLEADTTEVHGINIVTEIT